MEKNNSNLYVISLVAIVAVVGLVTLFVNPSDKVMMGEEGNIAGEAFYYATTSSKSIPAYTTTSTMAPTTSTKSIAPPISSEPTGMDRCVNPDQGPDELFRRTTVSRWDGTKWTTGRPGNPYAPMTDYCYSYNSVNEWSCLDGVPIMTVRRCPGNRCDASRGICA